MKSKIQYKMKGYLIFMLCLMMAINLSFGQSINDIGMPASPNVASLMKYGDVPVNLSSGIAGLSIPLCEISTKNVSLPISLTYHNTGLRSEEIPSWVGLGWDLNAGGLITRQVRGRSDEGPSGIFYYIDEFKNHLENDLGTEQEKRIYKNRLVIGEYDSQFDHFSFNFLGRSGSFFLDVEQSTDTPQAHLMPKSDLKIEVTKSGFSISKFVITDERGVKFEFEKILTSQSSIGRDIDWPEDLKWNDSAPTAWLITKIIDINGETLSFSYSGTFGAAFYRKVYSARVNHVQELSNPANNYEPCTIFEDSPSILTQTINEVYLESITHESSTNVVLKTIEFVRASVARNDMTGFLTTPAPSDFEFLDRILVKTGGGSPATIKTIKLVPDNNADRFMITGVNFEEGAKSFGYDFEYYSGVLPIDFENVQPKDHWGYSKSGSMGSHVPKQRFALNDCSCIEFGGGDRSAVDNSAGMIKSITYPTGGKTEFEYESNDYFYPGPFGDLPEVVKMELEDDYKETIYNETANSTNSEIEDNLSSDRNVDAWFITYYISADNALQASVEIRDLTTNEIIWSATTTTSENDELRIEIIPGHDYKLILYAGGNGDYGIASLTISHVDPTRILGTNQQGDNLILGGQRVSKITNFDRENHFAGVKKYLYQQGKTNKSSGKVRGEQHYLSESKLRSNLLNTNGQSVLLSSSYIDPLVGYHVYYDEVQVLYGENGENGKEVHEFYNPDEPKYIVPYAFQNDFSWRRGLPVRTGIYDKRNNLVRETLYDYNFNDETSNPTLSNRKSYKFSYIIEDVDNEYISPYNYSTHSSKTDGGGDNWSEFMHPASVTTIDHYGSEAISKTITYGYDGYPLHLQLTSQSETTSDGTRLTRFKYPDDIWVQNEVETPTEYQAIAKMKRNEAHMVGVPLQVTSFTNGVEILAAKQNTFKYDPTWDLILPNRKKSAIGNSSFKTDVSFIRHDNRGNVIEFQSGDGIVNVLIWGYNQQYVVARIQNATYTQVVAQLGDPIPLNGTNNEILSDAQINTLRTQLPNALVTTYEHRPLVGLIKQTDPNGLKTTYEYDEFERLYWVKDNDDYLLQKYEYEIGGN
ncbi:MAG: RHS repeat domain-containing protein [Cyclobacteriaceae bacterium]